MRTRLAGAAIVVGLVTITAGCATREDWAMWRSHSSHFASGSHATFSLRNSKDGSKPKVKRSDIEMSRTQDWWGVYVINVSSAQIFEN
jgi:hypothetical protein